MLQEISHPDLVTMTGVEALSCRLTEGIRQRHPHFQRELLKASCDLLDHALNTHQVPAYPSVSGEIPFAVRSKQCLPTSHVT
jgi:hypothetical protein